LTFAITRHKVNVMPTEAINSTVESSQAAIDQLIHPASIHGIILPPEKPKSSKGRKLALISLILTSVTVGIVAGIYLFLLTSPQHALYKALASAQKRDYIVFSKYFYADKAANSAINDVADQSDLNKGIIQWTSIQFKQDIEKEVIAEVGAGTFKPASSVKDELTFFLNAKTRKGANQIIITYGDYTFTLEKTPSDWQIVNISYFRSLVTDSVIFKSFISRRQEDISYINNQINSLDFTIYKPAYVPDHYHDDGSQIQTKDLLIDTADYEFDYGYINYDLGDPSPYEVYSIKKPASYTPPSNCGWPEPLSNATIKTPCQKIGQQGDDNIYYEKLSGTNVYGGMIAKGGSLVILGTTLGGISQNEILKVLSSIQPISKADLMRK